MRTLFEIIEDVKDGKKPDYDEILYSLLVYQNLFSMDHRNLREELMKEKVSPAFLRQMKVENSFNAYKNALNKDPKEFLGWNNDPENPSYQEFRKLGNEIVDKFLDEK